VIRVVCRVGALGVAAAASAVLLSGTAQGVGEPPPEGGKGGEPGTATAICHPPPAQDAGLIRCTARPGQPGRDGPATDY
jgi:hypothetical protein